MTLLYIARRFGVFLVIVWLAALAVLAMLIALAVLFNRWVLYPVRLLHRGVRRVARGSFDYSIELNTGDEMQALAEAFNDMTARLRVTYADLERQVRERSRQLVDRGVAPGQPAHDGPPGRVGQRSERRIEALGGACAHDRI